MAAHQDSHKELFLDILTKEEKEALLNKKMEDMRKKNEALQKRHAEIEADRKRAEKTGSAFPVQKEMSSAPVLPRPNQSTGESQRSRPPLQQQQQPPQQQTQPQTGKTVSRNKPPPYGGGPRGPKERPKSMDYRSDETYQYEPIVDIADLDARHMKGSHSPTKSRRNTPKEKSSVVSNQDDQEPSHISFAGTKTQLSNGNAYRGAQELRTYSSQHPGSRRQSRVKDFGDGPPPDPSYNFLADRSREVGSEFGKPQRVQQGARPEREGGRSKDIKRHPRNFGGPDFSNVKSQMKVVKEKEKDRRSYPPKNKLEMSIILTGSERIQYDEWKAERQRVDQERMLRQKTSSGEWRRAWDADKIISEYDEQQASSRTEPAKRPAGRIGSGRFDRGDHDDRRIEGAVQAPPVETEHKMPTGRSRGRGRGRGRSQTAASDEKLPRPRTWSGGDEARIVECSNDMLVVKIDKSRGNDDHSVEVEYNDDVQPIIDTPKPSPKKGKPSKRGSHNRNSNHVPQFEDVDPLLPTLPACATFSSQDESVNSHTSLSQSLTPGDTDEWEDCTTDSDFHGTTEDEADGPGSLRKNQLRGRNPLECRLNPEAPVFQPVSPDFTKAPSDHVKAVSWGEETQTSASLVSRSPSDHSSSADVLSPDVDSISHSGPSWQCPESHAEFADDSGQSDEDDDSPEKKINNFIEDLTDQINEDDENLECSEEKAEQKEAEEKEEFLLASGSQEESMENNITVVRESVENLLTTKLSDAAGVQNNYSSSFPDSVTQVIDNKTEELDINSFRVSEESQEEETNTLDCASPISEVSPSIEVAETAEDFKYHATLSESGIVLTENSQSSDLDSANFTEPDQANETVMGKSSTDEKTNDNAGAVEDATVKMLENSCIAADSTSQAKLSPLRE